MEEFKQKKNETRKNYLVRIAIAYIEEHIGYVGVDDFMIYDKAECDGYCLADDLRIEFNVDE